MIEVNTYYLLAFVALVVTATWLIARGIGRNGNRDDEQPLPARGSWERQRDRAIEYGASEIGKGGE
jgi:hypothetical protein